MTFLGFFQRSTPELALVPAPDAPDLDANIAAHWRD